MRQMLVAAVVCGLFVWIGRGQPATDEARFAKWEKNVAAIERRLDERPPDRGGVLFAGSSSIRLWDVGKAFPGWKTANTGFGGSEIRDVTHFADRLVLKHEPRAVVFYAGDNDIHSGRSAAQVRDDFAAFADAIHRRLPKTTVYFISIKPSVARWSEHDAQTRANDLVRELCGRHDWLGYIDVVPAMLGKDGRPRADLFVKDGLHLSDQGYDVWAETVRKAVK
jgi:lysophospholipase L1-like esterase